MDTVHTHKTQWTPCLFFNNSFWSSKFYFRRFDPNRRTIDFDFLGNAGAGRKGTKMKKTSNMDSVHDIS